MDNFQKELLSYLNHGVKEGYIDDELADEILNEWSHLDQREWLSMQEVKAQQYYDQWVEEEAERRNNSE